MLDHLRCGSMPLSAGRNVVFKILRLAKNMSTHFFKNVINNMSSPKSKQHSQALSEFLFDLKKRAQSDIILIEVDNAKIPGCSLMQGCGCRTVLFLNRLNSMPTLKASLSGASVCNYPQYTISMSERFNSSQQGPRARSVPTKLCAQRHHSTSRWTGETYSMTKTLDAQWLGARTDQSSMRCEKCLFLDRSPSSCCSRGEKHSFQHSKSLVRQTRSATTESTCRMISEYTPSRNVWPSTFDLPTLPIRRKSIDKNLEEILEVLLPSLEEDNDDRLSVYKQTNDRAM